MKPKEPSDIFPKKPHGGKSSGSSPVRLPVTEAGKLLDFLFAALPDKSRTTVKSYLTHRQVSVNKRVLTKFDAPLVPGDTVEISQEKGREEFRHPMLRIVYEDDELIVIDKKYGLLSMGTERENRKTAYHILSEYVKRADPRNLIFILHRLDRETSGLMMFARSMQVQEKMQSRWNETVLERKYYAVVEGVPAKAEGRIVSYLAENKAFQVYVTDAENGREAITRYRVLKENGAYALLELELETGRKNQIRVQLAHIGHPVAGDKKYGAKTNPLDRVALHAGSIVFLHPSTGERIGFEPPVPYRFNALFDRRRKP